MSPIESRDDIRGVREYEVPISQIGGRPKIRPSPQVPRPFHQIHLARLPDQLSRICAVYPRERVDAGPRCRPGKSAICASRNASAIIGRHTEMIGLAGLQNIDAG